MSPRAWKKGKARPFHASARNYNFQSFYKLPAPLSIMLPPSSSNLRSILTRKAALHLLNLPCPNRTNDTFHLLHSRLRCTVRSDGMASFPLAILTLPMGLSNQTELYLFLLSTAERPCKRLKNVVDQHKAFRDHRTQQRKK